MSLLKILLIPSFIFLSLYQCSSTDWRRARRESAAIAPLPEQEPRAIVHIYAARAVRWRGFFAVHSWISLKQKNATSYTNYHVMGWRVRRGEAAIVRQEGIPDGYWFGSKPELISEVKGIHAEKIIPQIEKLIAEYPYQNSYTAWPGPNSNTFISYLIRNIRELGVELPPHAIGKDWINKGSLVGFSESGTGVQFSLFALLGLTLGLSEGIEINLIGLSFGVDILRPAIKLPIIGRIGMRDKDLFLEADH